MVITDKQKQIDSYTQLVEDLQQDFGGRVISEKLV
jgi:hypothetical protein